MSAKACDVETKRRPKAALQFSLDDRGSDGQQRWLRLSPIGHKANARKAEDHHGPCGRLWHGSDGVKG